MRWQHCGRMDDHGRHKFIARQQIVVTSCVCDSWPCVCPEDGPIYRQKEELFCPGKQLRSIDIPVTTEVMT